MLEVEDCAPSVVSRSIYKRTEFILEHTFFNTVFLVVWLEFVGVLVLVCYAFDALVIVMSIARALR